MCICFDFSRRMNKPGTKVEMYCPTDLEQVANIVTHGVFIPLSIVAIWAMSTASSSYMHQVVAVVYGVALLTLAVISTTYHAMSLLRAPREWVVAFHLLDRFTIYLFIAASYTPWLLLQELQSVGIITVCFVWLSAIAGVIYSYFCYQKYHNLDTLFYVLIGVVPSLPLVSEMQKGHWELLFGGLVYIGGIKFFRSDGRLPFAHAIWHLCVALATTVHFIGVWKHLF